MGTSLSAIMTRAFLMVEVAKEHHVWPDDAMMVVHSDDEEGNQFRRHFDQEQGWVKPRGCPTSSGRVRGCKNSD